MHKYLVIVESPAKVKTISKFLGANYKVMAHPEQVKIMLRPRLLHKQQLKKVLKQKKQQRRPAIQRIKQQQKRVQQLLLKNWTTPKQRKKLPAHRKAAQVL